MTVPKLVHATSWPRRKARSARCARSASPVTFARASRSSNPRSADHRRHHECPHREDEPCVPKRSLGSSCIQAVAGSPPMLADGIGIRASTNHGIAVTANIPPHRTRRSCKASRRAAALGGGPVACESLRVIASLVPFSNASLLSAGPTSGRRTQPSYVNGENCPVLPVRSSV